MQLILSFLVLEFYLAVSLAFLDFCVEPEEQERLTGVAGELCYVKNGKMNNYAMDMFTVPVKSSINTLHFIWQSKDDTVKPHYTLEVKYQSTEAMGNWSSSLKSVGVVPDTREEFTVTLPCTGKVNAETDVTILMTITAGKGHYPLKLKRKKFCIKRAPDATMEETSQPAGNLSREDDFLSAIDTRSAPVSSSTKFIAITVTCIIVLVIVVGTVILIMCKNQKKNSGNESSFMLEQELMVLAPSSILNRHELTDVGCVDEMRSESQRQSPLETPYEYGTSQYESVIHPPTAVMAPTGPRSTVPDEDDAMADVMESLVNVDPSLVEVHDTIASGTFSLIQRGFLTVEYPDTGETVAREVRIKTVKPGASYVQKTIMFEDGLILYGMQHPNINSLIGCVFGPSVELPMLLYNGGNYSNLRDLLASANRTHFLPLTELVYLGLQALDGIRYLHSCGVIHKDIAARNCLIFPDLNLQLSDSALSRDLFPDDYQCLLDNNNRPIKWLAPESLNNFEFSSASDVWSFGVLLWELMSFGCLPFNEIDAYDIPDLLRSGHRHPQPPNCPDFLFEQMTNCWKLQPAARSSVDDLLLSISDFHANLANYV